MASHIEETGVTEPSGSAGGPSLSPGTPQRLVTLRAVAIACATLFGWLNSRGFRRFTPDQVLSPGELLTIYVMLSIAGTLCSHDLLQIMIPMLTYPSYNANPQNRWDELILPHLPHWAIVTDPEAIGGLAGVDSVTRLDGSLPRYEVRGRFEADIVGSISRTARDKGWELIELHESRYTLEDTFIALTRQTADRQEVVGNV